MKYNKQLFNMKEVLIIIALLVIPFLPTSLLKLQGLYWIIIYKIGTAIIYFSEIFVATLYVYKLCKNGEEKLGLIYLTLIQFLIIAMGNFCTSNMMPVPILILYLILSIFEVVIFMYLCWIYKNSKNKYNILYLIFCIFIIILLFAVMYSMIYYIDFPKGKDNFKIVNSNDVILFFDFIYYSVVTFTTLGYGDIIPVSWLAKGAVMFQVLVFVIFISIILLNSKNNEGLKDKSSTGLIDTKKQKSNNVYGNYKRSILMALLIIVIIGGVTITILYSISIYNSKYNPDYGSLIGGALGGIGTLIAVLYTLKYNENTQDILRHDNIRPYIKAWHLNGAVSMDSYKDVPNYDLVYSPEDKQFLERVKFQVGNNMFARNLVIENIGHGVATELVLKIENEGGTRYSTNDIINLGAGKTELYRFIINKEFMRAGKYKILFTYRDMLQKAYSQEIEFEIVKDSSQETGVNLKDFLRITPQKEIDK